MPLRVLAAALSATALLAGCAPAAEQPVAVVHGGTGAADDGLHGTEISDVIGRPALVLPDTDGAAFDLRDRPAEEVTAVFFGYTRCPDVCPSTMADLAAALRQLDRGQRDDVRVVFVTEDPATDTPRVLRGYLDRFDRSFTGLVGGSAATERALDALKATRTELRPPVPGETPGTHTTGRGEEIDHAGSVYVFSGDRTVVYTGGTTPRQYAEDFRALLS